MTTENTSLERSAAPSIRRALRFILNDRPIHLDRTAASDTLLDFLRIDKRLTGTKEGCAEGDCGACTVLLGRPDADDELRYESANACIVLMGMIDGCHVVTVEHLSPRGGPLHPIQQAMVDEHGSQCGFCTPGFVMSLYALWMRKPDPDRLEIERALQGNLCRCTGYAPIIRAAMAVTALPAEDDPVLSERERITGILQSWNDGSRLELTAPPRDNGSEELGSAAVEPSDVPYEGDVSNTDNALNNRILRPASVDDLAQLLEENPDARIVAGATDVGLWVTKFMREIGPLIPVGHLTQLKKIEEVDGTLRIGAGASYTDALTELAGRIPAFAPLLWRIGGNQIRNMGTIGGNIANGSPIGDMPPPLIALGAILHLRKGSEQRKLPLAEFFIDYGKQDRREGEFVEAVSVPLPSPEAHIAFHKVSKRRDEDITACLGAFHLKLAENGTIETLRIAYGGMAGVPKRAKTVEKALTGKPWSSASVDAALAAFEEDFEPLSDMRASAEYRMMVAKNLLRRFFAETQDRQLVGAEAAQ
ncbi:xanthine dehydrogenase small subunit [Notoacmeibacter sp. MSK16QG-6]|uniref:xanthine dehydrogenase small subunit n=1 Tax=Notoacmeibacter sp. MSK16QG-6 TaxID=2957982 RepID=UPI00209FE71C|nr:xanthine dehydrogenase small subunit [Notoacmeibacter sp. MSK16QG-6]MCP1199775.1 xanthine dehydrogenase small subunit [Notoacmeibacter sp. MSK16QG-6]